MVNFDPIKGFMNETIDMHGKKLYPCNDFIFIDDEEVNDEICDNLIDYFHNENEFKKTRGSIIDDNGQSVVSTEFKNSVDMSISSYTTSKKIYSYLVKLNEVVKKYVEKFPFIVGSNPWSLSKVFNIQHYPIGGGYGVWHTERNSANKACVYRNLVWMTFLNDVSDGGTEWFHQNLYVPAKKGRTVVWPSDWTHHHRGRISNTKEKYIITGWHDYT